MQEHLITETVSKDGGQAMVYVCIFSVVGADSKRRRFHIRIYSDAYRAQCYAKIELWNDDAGQWRVVHSIPPGQMQTPEGLYSLLGVNNGHFHDDHAELLRVAYEVVGVK